MDVISGELLMTMATGAAGEAGRQLWAALARLVGRRGEGGDGREGSGEPGAAAPVTGELELASLRQAPHDQARARALSEALGRRADQDALFRAGLAQWLHETRALRTGDGETANTISGGTQHGPVLQGRDFSGITFNSPDSDRR